MSRRPDLEIHPTTKPAPLSIGISGARLTLSCWATVDRVRQLARACSNGAGDADDTVDRAIWEPNNTAEDEPARKAPIVHGRIVERFLQ